MGLCSGSDLARGSALQMEGSLMHADQGAEGEGFEPPGPRGPPVFKTGAFDQALPPLRMIFGLQTPLSDANT
jgi:hypothetical protein